MKFSGKKILLTGFWLVITTTIIYCQEIKKFGIAKTTGFIIDRITLSDSSLVPLSKGKPLFSFLLNNRPLNTSLENYIVSGNRYLQTFNDVLKVTSTIKDGKAEGNLIEIEFSNTGRDTLTLSNVVPFGEDTASVCITGKGPWDLARAWLSRPGYKPVRVILPDNAWEMGYVSFKNARETSVCAIARRTKIEGAQKQRYDTKLPPGAKVTYTMHASAFSGDWQNGMRLMFRDKYLYDLEKFDNSLYERVDLKWIRESYQILLQMAWDREFYDRLSGKYNYAEILKKGIEQFGLIDVYGIWPTWPRLGLDQRNQWDLYRDLPGGTKQLRNFVKMSQQSGTKFFIAYNPWDRSSREEDHYRGMAGMIAETEADGVVLDTSGASSKELQSAADSVRKGVIMYSEGMAVTKDMPGIVSGRVHNAIFLSPELNLNKLIKPDFSIFRVCDVGENLVHREIAIAFFNGYGTELNMYRPGGRDDDYRDDMNFLGATTFILRQNNDAFLDQDWTPLIGTTIDNVYVNRWKSGAKTIYTILNMRPEGNDGKLFKGSVKEGRHWISLWNHQKLTPVIENGISYIPSATEGWSRQYTGTRREGSIDCISDFPVLIRSSLYGDSLKVNSTGKGKLVIWKGNPSYHTQFKEFRIKNDTAIRIRDIFGVFEGKIVLQLIENKRLKDEDILDLEGGKPWIVSRNVPTEKATSIPEDMVLIPGGQFTFNVSADDEFMPYPDVSGKSILIDSFLIDRFPVTNSQYYDFLMSSGYRPADTTRFLRHWKNGTFRQGQERYPVVNLSLEDMKAYAKWAGKRLPSEAEWQLAAQGKDKRKWPWGNEFHGALCNNSFARPTPVDAFIKGQSPFGVADMVGNVWQMTGDMYFNGSYYMSVIRGGSYYKPESSWWYIQGGPQPLDKTQILLMVSPGFDRSNTLGFRCVKDVGKLVVKKQR
jgi:formylglycine-generating enzyme required for sulfatase activity